MGRKNVCKRCSEGNVEFAQEQFGIIGELGLLQSGFTGIVFAVYHVDVI